MFNTQAQLDAWDNAPNWVRFIAIFVAGALAAMGQAPTDSPGFTLLGLGFGIWAARLPGGHSQFAYGWMLGLGYFMASLYWIMEPFWVDAAATGLLAVPAWVAMSGGLALFWGVAFRMVKGPDGLLLCLSLTAAEFARAYILTGFPWALIGYVWVDTAVYQIASIVGPHGMTLLTVFYAYVVARGKTIYGALFVILAVVFQQLPPIEGPVAALDAPSVRLIHPNVLQQDKWHPDKREGIYQQQLALTAAQPTVDLTIWPETSVYLPMRIAQSEIAAVSNGGRVLVGGQRRDENNLFYNSMFIVGPDGQIEGTYDKSRLVPFGEYIPFGEFLARFGLRGLSPQSGLFFKSGDGPTILDIPEVGKVQPLICYEGIFPQDVGRTEPRPDMIVLISNDAWFGTFNGPAQHLAQARARAIELGIPIVRVANRGVSAVIDAKGGLGTAIGINATGYIDALVPPPLAPTIYARFRDLPAVFFGLLLAFAVWNRRTKF
ncbi:MAG: apolipoprotein N-acyltransferase [Planktomarina sp.]